MSIGTASERSRKASSEPRAFKTNPKIKETINTAKITAVNDLRYPVFDFLATKEVVRAANKSKITQKGAHLINDAQKLPAKINEAANNQIRLFFKTNNHRGMGAIFSLVIFWATFWLMLIFKN